MMSKRMSMVGSIYFLITLLPEGEGGRGILYRR